MREYTVGLHKKQVVVVTVIASSPEEAKARAVDWMNNGQDFSSSDEYVIDYDDDPRAQQDEWFANLGGK